MIDSKLPNVGTTIFTLMSALASKNNAINLGQGFPDFDCDPELIKKVEESMRSGLNQYPPMIGIQPLRDLITAKIKSLYNYNYDSNSEITITAGGTQAIFTVITSMIRINDEVIIIEPAYDAYAPAVELCGGKVIPIQMTLNKGNNEYQIPWESLKNSITSKTRLLIINTPHNPTGTIWNKQDLIKLSEVLKDTDIYLCSDEVYEHMVYDHTPHQSVSSNPELAKRSFVISSFGKTLHVTGWKVGYVAAPSELSNEFRKTHQFNVFTVNTPMQYGISEYLKNPKSYLELSGFYQIKRDYFRSGLANTNFKLLPVQGTYFQCADYTELKIPEAKLNEKDFCEWLTTEIGVAAIPLSAFYQNERNEGIIRFCFAKQKDTLEKAIARLKKL